MNALVTVHCPAYINQLINQQGVLYKWSY